MTVQTWTAIHTPTASKANPDTSIGYSVECQDCHGEATMVQTTRELQGVGEGRMIQCEYIRRCPRCDGHDH